MARRHPTAGGSMSREGAFTVIEIMITVAVVAVLMVVVAPGFGVFILNNRISGQTNDFLANLAVARSESAKRSVRVTVCASTTYSSTPPSCTGGGASAWNQGYIVFADLNANGTFDAATDVLLRAGEPLSGGNALTSSGLTIPDKFQYRPSGATNIPAAGGTFKLCDQRTGNFGRTISISPTGRASASTTACP
jgi:type IV fimbrial biogenesis protein FimT